MFIEQFNSFILEAYAPLKGEATVHLVANRMQISLVV